MLVSFIIVAYNAEKVIKSSLKCLKKQTYPHDEIEIILVDSNSSDKTKSIMEEYKNTVHDFKRIIVLDNPKKTLPCGWNVALKESKGEVILRVDAHSTFPNNFIEENVKTLTLDYETSSLNSKVSVNGNKDLKDGSKVKILVTAEDGTKKEYILNIFKENPKDKTIPYKANEERNPLIIMSLSLIAFGLIGGIVYVIKKH